MLFAVDFDGTLARQVEDWSSQALDTPIPVQRMVDRVAKWLSQGHEVDIFTASVYPLGTIEEATGPYEMVRFAEERKKVIETFCKKYFGRKLPVTCIKSAKWDAMYDDRAITVLHDTGRIPNENQQVSLIKISKVGAGYIEQEGTDFRCRDCWKFIPASRQCAEMRVDDRVKPNGYCTMWAYGSPQSGLRPSGAYTPEEIGYGELKNGTKCERCTHYEGDGKCEIVDGVIEDEIGCCANQKPEVPE